MSAGGFPETTEFTAKTLPGLEEVLAAELQDLGAEDPRPGRLAVSFRGGEELLYRANLCLRSALRVLVPLREFSAERTQEIYNAAYELPWETWLDTDATFAVDAAVYSRTFTHGSFCALKVKDAVADRFTKKFGRRPAVDTRSPALRINIFIHENHGVLSLDASGESLHRRGYRREKTEAPLSEVLAAGILLLSGWDGASPLHDPLCGSGTFLAEAGLLSAGIPPGFLREKFGFMGWKTFAPELWKKVREGELSRGKTPRAAITGADSDPAAVEIARGNLQRAGLEKHISVTRGVFEEAAPPSGPGLIVMNPPYGKRLRQGKTDPGGEEAAQAEICGLYTRIGDTLKRSYAGWTAWIFSSNLGAIKHIGLRPFRRVPLKNGPLECRLVGIKLF
ncbi:MAG: THUMP domain-containing protein [Spirochaetaceae bacterium]|nr:THUMP domain-containing protein [Spirochaetaceae bacterium]